jgi:hypothetical protein
MTVEQALAGARLFQPEIHEEEDERHRIVFHVHHLLYDGESFPLLWRDLSELYAASREARAPQLPELGLEYVDFAGQQRGSWIEDRRRALPFWRSLAAGATGAVEWPAPAVVAGHPYEQEVTQFELSPASARAATAIARRHRVSPFFVLLAATAGAIAAVTGCEDPLIGTDVANRGSRHKQEVGHFLSSRLTRFVEPRERPVADLVGDAREAWFAAEDFDDVYIGEVLPELGISGYIPVLLDPVEPHRGPCFDEVEVVPIDLPPWPYYWRDAWISWLVDGRTFGCQMAIRRSRVAGWVPDAVAAAIEARLGGGG